MKAANNSTISAIKNETNSNEELTIPTNKIVLISVTLGSLSFFTVAANMLILIAFARTRKLQTITNYFLASLAIADIFIGLISITLYAVYLNVGEWPFGEILCDIYLSIDYICSQVSVLSIVLICVDRYLTRTRPIIYRCQRTKKKVITAIVCSWFIAAILWVPLIFSFQYIYGKRTVPKNECYIQFIQDNWYVTLITAFIAYYGPVLLILFLYYEIYKLILHRKKTIQSLFAHCKTVNEMTAINNILKDEGFGILHLSTFFNNEAVYNKPACKLKNEGRNSPLFDRLRALQRCNNNRDTKDQPASAIPNESSSKKLNENKLDGEKKAATLLALIILAFVITWLPYDIFVLISPFCSTCITEDWWHFGYIFCYVNSALNPICYALGNKLFRNASIEMLPFHAKYWKKRKRKETYELKRYGHVLKNSNVSNYYN